MQTYHIHIKGRVQGVGFRPWAAQLAEARKLRGTVSNGMDGVHICLQTCETFAREYLDYLLAHPPPHSIITGYLFEQSGMADVETPVADAGGVVLNDTKTGIAPDRPYGLRILESSRQQQPDLLLTPDIALCANCREEITQTGNRRKDYPFTTCLHCGPRYSIITALPYDRQGTTMAGLHMCPDCHAEYHNMRDRRHFSQTNSCPRCAIRMHWYPSPTGETGTGGQSYAQVHPYETDVLAHTHPHGTVVQAPAAGRQAAIIPALVSFLHEGKIVAVKGIGGYLLLCDATREDTIMELRRRKHRPRKPFAVLYPSIEAAQQDLDIRPFEAEALLSPVAPIVLCKKLLKTEQADQSSLNTNPLPTTHYLPPTDFISPGLHRIGLMLPYTPLLQLISTAFGKPLVATSGNISGSPILYQDSMALAELWTVADGILTYDRDIVTPQDDSVWQFTDHGERIIIRRSRGMAPDLYPHTLGRSGETILATGADLKSAFAIHHGDKIYISQYLGDLEDYRAQEAWLHSQQHLLGLLQAKPARILADLHPGYYAHTEGLRLANEADIPFHAYQHHETHFAAVLAENNLFSSPTPVLGLVWDGTGYGSDGQSWGGETFIFEQGTMDRVLQLDYFPQLLGDKMSREPRLSALSLMHHHFDARKTISGHFSEAEWDFYTKLLDQEKLAQTSSMGRLIDAVSSILGICQYNSYEGQAAMELEALAASAGAEESAPYPLTIGYNRINWRLMIYMILTDLGHQVPKAVIARRFFASLAQLVVDIAYRFDIPRVALSGGVFQNALLLDLIRTRLPKDIELFTHQQLSPNDECIGLGQLALYHMKTYPLSPTPYISDLSPLT